MKGLKTITMAKEKAKKEWKTYSELLKKRKEKYLKEMKTAYWHLSKGRKIIDAYEVFKTTGISEKKEPRLAIAPADATKIYFKKWREGDGRFTTDERGNRNNSQVYLPEKTFPKWPYARGSRWQLKDELITTTVPIIPAQLLPNGKLSRYYLLWEVEDWQSAPKDPILLKRLSRNLFTVLATWNLTKLERAVVMGRV